MDELSPDRSLQQRSGRIAPQEEYVQVYEDSPDDVSGVGSRRPRQCTPSNNEEAQDFNESRRSQVRVSVCYDL